MSARVPNTPFLRFALLIDAAGSCAFAILLALAAGPLADPLGLPATFLFSIGIAIFPWVAAATWLGTRTALHSTVVLGISAGNVIWAAGSVALPMSGAVEPTGLGIAFIVSQAIVAALFALLQFMAHRQAKRAGMPPA